MNNKIRDVIRRVLKAAANTPNFFDLSDAERLNWMIAQAFILGQLSAARATCTRRRQGSDLRHEEDLS
jgi:hypothetical protein